MAEELTTEEKEQLNDLLGYGSNIQDGKHTVHSFLNNVANAEDTTKLGNLSPEELGKLETPVRSYKFLASYVDKVMNKPQLKEWFLNQSENATATSLSKDALLLKLAVVQRKELADVTPKAKKENKGWFGSKKTDEVKEE